MRCWQWFAVVRLSWSSQILLRHVLDLRTPLPRQGNVTDSFISVCSVHSFCASCERVWPYVLPATAGVSCISLYCLYYSVTVGRHSVFLSCLFVVGVRIYYFFRGKACDMFIHFRVIIFFFHPRYRSAGGLIVWRTFLNLSKMMYRLACFGRRHFVSLLSFSLICGYFGSLAWGFLEAKSKT